MRETMRASYTVEAAIIMPIVMILLGVVLERGITMYQQTMSAFGQIDTVCETDAVKTLYRLQMAEDILEEFGWN